MIEVGSLIHVRQLGRFEAARDAQFAERIHFSTRKVAALLAFLSVNPQQAATREQLGALLWGNSPDAQARQSLRQALLLLRKDLAPADVLDAGSDVIRLKPSSVSVDAVQLEELSASNDLVDIERAAGLAQGEFLAGFGIDEEAFEDWLRQQRRRFETVSTGALERYAEACELAGNGPQATATVERLLALDPLREDWQRLALKVYAHSRGHNEALAQAKVFEETLRRELGVSPEPETRELVRQIRQGQLARAVPNRKEALASKWLPTGPASDDKDAIATRLPEGPIRTASLRTLRGPRPMLRVGLMLAVALVIPSILLILNRAPPALWTATSVAPIAPNDANRPVVAALEKGTVALAVMPFTSAGDEGVSPGEFAELVTDELTMVLSSIAALRVISRETSRTLRGQAIDAISIGNEFGVSYLLEGSASLRGSRLRVNAGLVETRTGLRVWSQRFERDARERPAMQDEIVNSLARQLQVEVARIEGNRPATDPDVHALITRAWAEIFQSGKRGRDALEQANKLLLAARERDPENVQVQLGIGAYHVNMAIQLYSSDSAGHLAKGEDLLRAAIDRQPTIPGAHHFMGMSHVARNQLSQATAAFERAIELNPSHAPSYAQLGRVLVRLGLPEQGLKHVLYAMRLSPRDPGLAIWTAFAGFAELELKRFDRALGHFERALSLHPGQPRTVLCVVATHALLGDMPEARRRLEQLQRTLPHLTREVLVKRFVKERPDSQYRKGLQLVFSQSPEGLAVVEN